MKRGNTALSLSSFQMSNAVGDTAGEFKKKKVKSINTTALCQLSHQIIDLSDFYWSARNLINISLPKQLGSLELNNDASSPATDSCILFVFNITPVKNCRVACQRERCCCRVSDSALAVCAALIPQQAS